MSVTADMTTQDELAAALVRDLKAVRRAQKGSDRRTGLLRSIGEATVNLREFFTTNEGQPDWAGRTWTYRDFVSKLYAEAGYGKDEARTLQTTVRYHASNYLREKFTPEQLAEMGLRTESAVERSRETRKNRTGLVQAAQEAMRAQRVNGPSVLQNISAAIVILKQTTEADIAELPYVELDDLSETLAHLTQEIERLSAAADARRASAE